MLNYCSIKSTEKSHLGFSQIWWVWRHPLLMRSKCLIVVKLATFQSRCYPDPAKGSVSLTSWWVPLFEVSSKSPSWAGEASHEGMEGPQVAMIYSAIAGCHPFRFYYNLSDINKYEKGNQSILSRTSLDYSRSWQGQSVLSMLCGGYCLQVLHARYGLIQREMLPPWEHWGLLKGTVLLLWQNIECFLLPKVRFLLIRQKALRNREKNSLCQICTAKSVHRAGYGPLWHLPVLHLLTYRLAI